MSKTVMAERDNNGEWRCSECGAMVVGERCICCGSFVVVDKTPKEMIITPAQERYCPHCGSRWDGDFCYGCGNSG